MMERGIEVPVERDAAGVSTASLVRRSGLLAVAAGSYMVVLPFLHPSDEVGTASAAWVPVHLLYFAALVAILLALVGIFASQIQRSRRLGLAGFLGSFVGTAMMLLEGREHLFSSDFGQGAPSGLWELILASFVFSVGYILLGVAISRSGILPRLSGLLLAVGGPVVAFSPPIGILAVLIVGHALFGLGLILAGYALFAGAGEERLS